MNKLYDLITWQNNTAPALNEDNLNAMSIALDGIDDRVVELGGAILEVAPRLEYLADNAEQIINDTKDYAESAEADAQTASTAAESAKDDREDAEAYATGKRNGQDVPSTDPAYHNNAKYYSQITNPTVLANMSDVDVTTKTDGDVLQYNGTSQKWENKALPGGALSTLNDVNISSASDGQALVYDNASSKWKNTNLSGSHVGYDNTSSGMTSTNAQDALDELHGIADDAADGVDDLMSMVAPTETTSTASQAYSVGDQFIYNGQLVKATAAIAEGGTITVGSGGNCVVADDLVTQVGREAYIVVDSTGKTYGQAITLLYQKILEYFGDSFLGGTMTCAISSVGPAQGIVTSTGFRASNATHASTYTRFHFLSCTKSGNTYTPAYVYDSVGNSYSSADGTNTTPSGNRSSWAYVREYPQATT